MFLNKDYSLINEDHFVIVEFYSTRITLKTKGNSHYWCIRCNEGSTWRSYTVEHKHRFQDQWHFQGWRPKNLEAALDMITRHDEWWMTTKKRPTTVPKNNSES